MSGAVEVLEPPKRSKLGLAVFWGGAAFLAPWIVSLAVVQEKAGVGYHRAHRHGREPLSFGGSIQPAGTDRHLKDRQHQLASR